MIIAFLARAGSGKTTAAKYLEKKHGAVRVSFAGPLKELAKRLYDLTDEQVYGSLKEEPDERLEELFGDEGVTPRRVLQLLGNQAREIIGRDVWIRAAMNECAKHRLAVIDDCRYVNEAEAVAAVGGLVIKIEAPTRKSSADPNHPSEAEVDRVPEELLTATIENRLADVEDFYADLEAALASDL